MPDDSLKLIPAAFTGCAHGETCRNMKVMEGLRVQNVELLRQVAEAKQESEKWFQVARTNLFNLDAAELERDEARAQLAALARAVDGVKHLILGGWHEPLCPVGDPCAGCQVRHALAAPLAKAALAQPEAKP